MNKQVQHFRGLSVPITEYEDGKDEFIENTDCENVNYLVFYHVCAYFELSR